MLLMLEVLFCVSKMIKLVCFVHCVTLKLSFQRQRTEKNRKINGHCFPRCKEHKGLKPYCFWMIACSIKFYLQWLYPRNTVESENLSKIASTESVNCMHQVAAQSYQWSAFSEWRVFWTWYLTKTTNLLQMCMGGNARIYIWQEIFSILMWKQRRCYWLSKDIFGYIYILLSLAETSSHHLNTSLKDN